MNKQQVAMRKIRLGVLKRLRKVLPQVTDVWFSHDIKAIGDSYRYVAWVNGDILIHAIGIRTSNPKVAADLLIRQYNNESAHIDWDDSIPF